MQSVIKCHGRLNKSTCAMLIKYPVLIASLISFGLQAAPTIIDTTTTAGATLTIATNGDDLTITDTGALIIPGSKTDCTYDIDATNWTLTNNGKIESTAYVGHSVIHFRATSDGDYKIINTGTVSLTGTDQSFIWSAGGADKFDILNSGTISGKSETLFGIVSTGSSTLKVTNEATGKMLSETGAIIETKNDSETVTIENAGEISTGGTAISAAGKTVIHNSGKIAGGTTAISLGGQDDELQLEVTSVIDGMVKAGGGNDKLTLQGDSGEGSLNLAQYSGFDVFSKEDKGTWELTGTNPGTETSDWNLNAGTLKIAKDATVKGSVIVGSDVTENVTLEVNGKVDNGADAAIKFNSNSDSKFIYNTDAALGEGGVNVSSGNVYLTGTGSVDAPVEISAGSFYIGDALKGTGGSVSADIKNEGQLVFNLNDDYTYKNVISGTGKVVKQGADNVTLTSDQAYTGGTDILSGALILANDIKLATSTVSVAKNSSLGGYGTVEGDVTNNGLIAVANASPGNAQGSVGNFTVGGDLTNNGELRMGAGKPGSVFTVEGNYTGNDGLLTMDMALNDDTTSSGDLLVVKGDTAGKTSVSINNVGGLGGQTIEGIRVVEVDGQSSGEFVQQGRIVAGAYDYYLTKGTTSNPQDGSWYLRSETEPAPQPEPEPQPAPQPPVRPEAASYLGNQSAAKAMFMGTMHDRMGEQNLTQNLASEERVPSTWIRTSGSRMEGKAGGSIDQQTDTTMFQLGSDLTSWTSNGDDRVNLGFMFGSGYAKTDSYSAASREGSRHSTGKARGYNTGLYGTWYADAKSMTGLYIDSSLQYSWFNNETKGEQLASEEYDSDILQASIEAGYAFEAVSNGDKTLYIEPQAQLIYTSMNSDDFREANGTLIHNADADGYTTRLGARMYGRVLKEGYAVEPFIEANWWHDTAANAIQMNEQKVYDDLPASRYEVKAGVEGKVSNSLHSWINAGYQGGENDFSEITGMVGVKYLW